MTIRKGYKNQDGAALVTALLILLILTILSLSAVRFTTLGKRVALNDELRVSAFQTTQSIIDAAISNPANTPVTGNEGDTFCTAGSTGCTQYIVTLPSEVSSLNASVRITRLAPTGLTAPPRKIGSSLVQFAAAKFEVEGTYDQTAAGLGQSTIREGVLVLVPKL